ncbi:uncharacterized protein LOC132696223 [Cylas formicarius]|uniref:uncharacterized protein LOC132696223 n=1 Tax=Cylas formicarius TaxID=197179 RepID=UPI002958879A|nr:uncharacterized protein LOC132696223 [Cylas formicarius]
MRQARNCAGRQSKREIRRDSLVRNRKIGGRTISGPAMSDRQDIARTTKVHRLAALFEIPRPDKSHRVLKRSASLPISTKSVSFERVKTQLECDDDDLVLGELPAGVDEATVAPRRLYMKRSDPARRSNRSSHQKTSREIIDKKTANRTSTVKQRICQFENFIEAERNGETENYRRSLVSEMDEEIEKMKLDGFEDDFYVSPDEDDGDDDDVSAALQIDDQLGTSFGDDLERGLYFVETYNADGKELVIVSVQIDRKVVDLDNFQDLQLTSQMLVRRDGDGVVLIDLEEASSRLSLDDSNGSKRTTIYSTASGDSFDDRNGYDECFDSSDGYVSARRETVCDKEGIVRIERIARAERIDPEDDENGTVEYEYIAYDGYPDVPEPKKETLFYIIDEIKVTERKYVEDLRKVVEDYKPYIEERAQMSEDKSRMLFGNIDDLYARQTDFLEAVENSEGDDVRHVVQCFIDFEDLFELYPKYFRSKLKSNVIARELAVVIKERQDELNDKLDLSAYLLTPLQRLGKYKLFLENIVKQLEKEARSTGFACIALDVIKKAMSRGNDAVAASSILNSPLHWTEYGSFMMREKFVCLKPKRVDTVVFLFEEAIVFTFQDPRNSDEFIFWQSIKTNDLRIATFEDTTLHLTDYTKTKRRNSSKYTYVLDAKTPKAKETWREKIEDILWRQLMKAKENTLRLYQSENRRKSKTRPKINRERIKSAGASVFYVD